jgi:hypothetical protein
MQIVPTLIFWSIAWLPSVGMDGQRVPRGELEAAWQPVETSTASPFALKLAHSSTADVPSLADLGTTQTEDDDFFEGDALDFGPLPRWADSGHTEAASHFLPPCDRADSVGRSFSIRC